MIGVYEDRFFEYFIIKVNIGFWWFVFGLKFLDDLKNIFLDLNKIKKFSGDNNIIGIILFCIEIIDKKCDYYLRFIVLYVGVIEDFVCGIGNVCVLFYIVYYNILDKISFIGE